MKKNKETLAEKYFNQKYTLWFDVSAVILAVLGLFVHIFGFKISYLGIPMIFAGAIIKIIDLFINIKDKEFDEYMADLKERNIVIYPGEMPDYIVELYDLTCLPIKTRRDQNHRSNIYSFAAFKIEGSFCKLDIYKINALENNVSHSEHTIPLTCKYEITETPSPIPKRPMTFLTFNDKETIKIPVKNASYDLEEFMKNFK